MPKSLKFHYSNLWLSQNPTNPFLVLNQLLSRIALSPMFRHRHPCVLVRSISPSGTVCLQEWVMHMTRNRESDCELLLITVYDLKKVVEVVESLSNFPYWNPCAQFLSQIQPLLNWLKSRIKHNVLVISRSSTKNQQKSEELCYVCMLLPR